MDAVLTDAHIDNKDKNVYCDECDFPRQEYARNVRETQATVGGSPFGPFISVARGHSRE